jgi:hypothetical protein
MMRKYVFLEETGELAFKDLPGKHTFISRNKAVQRTVHQQAIMSLCYYV